MSRIDRLISIPKFPNYTIFGQKRYEKAVSMVILMKLNGIFDFFISVDC